MKMYFFRGPRPHFRPVSQKMDWRRNMVGLSLNCCFEYFLEHSLGVH